MLNLMLMKIVYLFLLSICIFCAKAQVVPHGVIAPEDAAFNTYYSTATPPVVTGRLLNASEAELKDLHISFTLVTPFAEFQKSVAVSVKPDGRFKVQLDYALPYQQIWFGVGDIFAATLYVNKGLDIELDIKKIKDAKGLSYNGDGVRYLGKDGPVNVYLNNYTLYQKQARFNPGSEREKLVFSNLPLTDSLLQAYNSLSDSIKQIQENYIAANPSPYSWMLENERLSDYYGGLCLKYQNAGKAMPGNLWQKVKSHKAYLISNNSATFYSYLAGYVNSQSGPWVAVTWKDVATLPDLNQGEQALVDSLKASETMQGQGVYTSDNVKKWTRHLNSRIITLASMHSLNRNIKAIDSEFSAAKADFLKLGLGESKDLNEQEQELQRLIASMQTNWCISVEKKEYNSRLAKINEINKLLSQQAKGTLNTGFGKPIITTPFGASMYKAPSIKATDFLVKLKQSFPDKAIIIDRWATWCAPCLAEMPHSKTLQVEAKDLPVVFVYLCTLNGSSEEKWKSKVAEIKQPGVHFLISEDLDADISKYFSFSGYPGYAFIDKTGKYKPGAITRMSHIKDKTELAALVNN